MSAKAQKQLYGVIPYKVEDDCVWVMMVTSQTRKRWIFPNGNIEKGETGAQAAAREAFEEAGVKGSIDKKHTIDAIIGKSAPDGIEDVSVEFFAMEVLKQADKWPEKDERKRRWLTLDKAKSVIKDDDFKAVVTSFSKQKFVAKLVAA
ncbi:MAG: NUDIX domain-containing protein [Pseudomonadota bacterium]